MAGQFTADPMVLNAKGNEMVGQSEAFTKNYNQIYTIINEMVTSAFVSPDARAKANEMLAYKDDLAAMARVILDYGNYCITSGRTVVNNQNNIIDNFKINSDIQ